MKNKSFNATYVIKIKGSGSGDHTTVVTSQMLRDKMIVALQEMFLLHYINGFSIEEIDTNESLSKFEREATEKEKRSRKYS